MRCLPLSCRPWPSPAAPAAAAPAVALTQAKPGWFGWPRASAGQRGYLAAFGRAGSKPSATRSGWWRRGSRTSSTPPRYGDHRNALFCACRAFIYSTSQPVMNRHTSSAHSAFTCISTCPDPLCTHQFIASHPPTLSGLEFFLPQVQRLCGARAVAWRCLSVPWLAGRAGPSPRGRRPAPLRFLCSRGAGRRRVRACPLRPGPQQHLVVLRRWEQNKQRSPRQLRPSTVAHDKNEHLEVASESRRFTRCCVACAPCSRSFLGAVAVGKRQHCLRRGPPFHPAPARFPRRRFPRRAGAGGKRTCNRQWRLRWRWRKQRKWGQGWVVTASWARPGP